jgi:hypothetical protein
MDAPAYVTYRLLGGDIAIILAVLGCTERTDQRISACDGPGVCGSARDLAAHGVVDEAAPDESARICLAFRYSRAGVLNRRGKS